jgi:putative endonuclease
MITSTTSSLPDGRHSTGQLGERLAERHLVRLGLVVVERNYRCRAGEIDLVAEDAGTLVFVEVRARRSDAFGTPEESITPRKARTMIECAQTYLEERAAQCTPWRIDLVAIRLEGSRLVRLDHYRHVLER